MTDGGRNNKGFTMVELIVAVALFAIVSGGLMSAFSNSAQINGRAKAMLKATNVAQCVVENMKQFTYDKLETDVKSGFFVFHVMPANSSHSGTSMPLGEVGGVTTASDMMSTMRLNDWDFAYTDFTEAAGGGGMVSFTGLVYEDEQFDVVISVKDERTTPTSASYYVYTTEVSVYLSRQDDSAGPLVVLKGVIYNKE